MSLKEYARKRTFSRTPEPAPPSENAIRGSSAEAGHKPVFCVQRHHARALHYDFRLELDGALKSWAVPKGPTLDPSVKRLAVHVEDHPLDYGSFEGNIPAGQYGAGSVMLWDRGTYEVLGKDAALDQYRRGDFKFRLDGEKLRGDFALVRTKGRGENQWLLLKKRDVEASPGWDPEDHARSVLSGRSQEEIAKDLPPRQPAQKKPAQQKTRKTNGRAAKAKAGDPPGTKTDESVVDLSRLRGARVAPMFASITPMQATPAAAPPEGDDWLYEVKWDGMRVVMFTDAEDDERSVRMLSRSGNDVTRQFPELTVAHQFLAARQAVVDGEVAVLDERGVPSFALLQPRMMASDAGAIAQMSRAKPVTFFAFDLLYLDGYDLRGVPLIERKSALQQILRPSGVLRLSEHTTGDGAAFLEAARTQGLEGIVAKRAGSLYDSRRSADWVKVKIATAQEFVICGYLEGERDSFASLVLGLYEGGKLVYTGNVGTGFDEAMLDALAERLKLLATSRSPFEDPPQMPRPVTWVRPELVCTVRFASWTPEGRLRAPVFLGLRPDIAPLECVRVSATVHGPADAETPAMEPPRPAAPCVLTGTAETATLTVDGRRLKFTNLNKLYYPREGYTKRDVIQYYDAVAPLLLPHLADRPLSLRRYPDGIQGESFFQKDARKDFPAWFRVESIEMEEGKPPTRLVVADGRASLLFLANLGCIDQNPWMSRVGSLEHPDFLLIDLDPQECSYDRIVEAAQLIRRKLDLVGLEGYPKTTGGNGMHVYVPLAPVYTYEQTRAFAEVLARWVAAERPDLFTTPRPVARREKGKVYFDYLQNGFGKTISAPYVLRAHPGAPVATPLAWHEVAPGLAPARFHIRNALDRFAQLGDLFRPVLQLEQHLEPAFEKLEAIMRRAGQSED
jgi:bifunctional non-homologous end joining protein LigD